MTTAFKWPGSRCNGNGFTLLEVMISVSIVALIFLSLFRMQSSTIGLATAGKFNTIAPILARQLLVKIDQDVADWAETHGDFGDNFPGFEWTCKILDASFEALDFISTESQDHFKEIQIEIMNSSASKSYKIQTWRFLRE